MSNQLEVDSKQAVRMLFNNEELQTALTIIEGARKLGKQPNADLKKLFINERMPDIEAKVGHKCDATYMAYLVEYYFLEDVE